MDVDNFDRLCESVVEAKEIVAGEKKPSRKFDFEDPNPKEIRGKLALTQEQFANLMNISVHTLRNWEQGRRKPEGPARVLLNVVFHHPEVFSKL